MTKLIDNYLLKHGMPKEELCAIKRRRYYYFGIAIFSVLAISFLTMIILGIDAPI